MHKIYRLNTEYLQNAEVFKSEYLRISSERQRKVDRMKPEKSKREALGAGLLLRRALEEEGLSPDHPIEYTRFGKPQLTGCHHLWFNLSHSENAVMCVMADHPVGCDVEKIETMRAGVARKVFSESEYQALQELPPDRQDEFFYRIWTRKESITKAFGCGMNVAFSRVQVWPDTDADELRKLMKEELDELAISGDFQIEFEEEQDGGYQYCCCHIR